ncbi:MAG: pilus assembly protein TadG-related protein, partial [Planctomycetaceae bacterium]
MRKYVLRKHLRAAAENRRGGIFVLCAVVIVVVLGFTAFTIDIGFITLTKTQLQNTSDAAALGALIEIAEGYGPGSNLTAAQIEAAAQQAAADVAASNRAGEQHAVYADSVRDVRLGQYTWNAGTGQWDKLWGVAPYNMVEVTLHRDQTGSTNGDRPLDLFFAPVLGTDQATLKVSSTAVLQPGVGFANSGVNGSGESCSPGILPITLDLETWTNLMNGIGRDDYHYNEDTGAISSGSDGILEVYLYPYGNQALPPGNRGTVDIGSNNN